SKIWNTRSKRDMIYDVYSSDLKPSRQDVMLSCAKDALVCKSVVTTGKAGKYISIDKGPKAVKDPNINTSQAFLKPLFGVGSYIFWFIDRKSTRLNSSHVSISYA